MSSYEVIYQLHAVKRMAQRGISEDDVERVLLAGIVIKTYPDDTPYPSKLLLGWSDKLPIHVVVATEEEAKRKIVITVYIPDPEQWEKDFRRKRV